MPKTGLSGREFHRELAAYGRRYVPKTPSSVFVGVVCANGGFDAGCTDGVADDESDGLAEEASGEVDAGNADSATG